MSLEPNATNVGYEVTGLGLKTRQIPDDKEIMLAPLNDKVTKMSLSYYAHGLLRHLKVEVLAGNLIWNKKAHTFDEISKIILEHQNTKESSLT
jgi:hypothetical protein